MKKHKIVYGKYESYLRVDILERNKKMENLPELVDVYIEMYKIYEKIDNTSNPIELFYLNQSIETLEFKMQELWGFPIDRNMHRYWRECPKCTCPEYDNYESRGTMYRHYNTMCPIHGTETRKLVNRENKINRIINGEEK